MILLLLLSSSFSGTTLMQTAKAATISLSADTSQSNRAPLLAGSIIANSSLKSVPSPSCPSLSSPSTPLAAQNTWSASFDVPTQLFMGAPGWQTVEQTYTIYSNGTLLVRDNSSDWFSIGGLSGLPAGAQQSSLVANATTATEQYTVMTNNQSSAHVDISYQIRKQFCVDAGLEITINGTANWGQAGRGILSLEFGNMPTTVEDNQILFGNTSGVSLGFNWNDSASMHSVYNRESNSLDYTVGNSFKIDPATLGTCTGSENAIVNNPESKVAYAAGRYWVFYDDGSDQGYRSSTNGSSWSSETVIAADWNTGQISVYADGSTIYYARACSAGVCYRYGTASSGGSITWSISESSFSPTYSSPNYPTIVVDSSGNMWVTVRTLQTSTYHAEVWKYTSSWSNVATTADNDGDVPILLTSSSGQALIFNDGGGEIAVEYTTNGGSSWSSPATYTISNGEYLEYSDALLLGDTVELAVESYTGTIPTEVYSAFYMAYTFGGSWSTPLDIGAAHGAAIATDGSSELAIVYTYSATTVDMVVSDNSGSSWSAAETISSSESGIGFLDGPSSDPILSSGTMAVIWEEGSSYPYDVRFATMSVPVNQPIAATLRGASGSAQTVTVLGCTANPSTFTGNGTTFNIYANSSCALTLELPSGYIWESTGTYELTYTTCSSGTCPTDAPSYMKSVEATLNPNPNGNEFGSSMVNLTSSPSTVTVSLYNSGYNDLTGAACDSAPCSNKTGSSGFSFQFNLTFPTFLVHTYSKADNDDYCSVANGTGPHGCNPFGVQAVIEFQSNGVCKAHPQGAPSSYPAPPTLVDSFECSHITGPGDSFEWIVDYSGEFLTNIKLDINGVTNDTWSPFGANGMFAVNNAPSSVNMSGAFAQSIFAGSTSGVEYGNIYSGEGVLSYSGVEGLVCEHGCTLYYSGEYANAEYTAIPASETSFNQTFDGGVFNMQYIGDSGSVSDPGYIQGPPAGNFYAQLKALTSGSTACEEGAFETGGPLVNGTIAIYGNSSSGYTSSVQVAVSSSSSSSCASATGWTTVYSGKFNATTAKWILVGSATSIEYVKITASYSGGAADIYVGSVSLFMGSYAQSETSSGVTLPSDLLQLNTSSYAVFPALTTGSSSSETVSFGTEYSGELLIDGYSGYGFITTYTIQYSSDDIHWNSACAGSWTSNSDGWIACDGVSQALYVLITVYYSGLEAGDLYVNGVYIA